MSGQVEPSTRSGKREGCCVTAGALALLVCVGAPSGGWRWYSEATYGLDNSVGWIDSERRKPPPYVPPEIPSPNGYDTCQQAAALLVEPASPIGVADPWANEWAVAVRTGDQEAIARHVDKVRAMVDANGEPLRLLLEAGEQEYVGPQTPAKARGVRANLALGRLASSAVAAAELAHAEARDGEALQISRALLRMAVGLAADDAFSLVRAAQAAGLSTGAAQLALPAGGVSRQELLDHAQAARDARRDAPSLQRVLALHAVFGAAHLDHLEAGGIPDWLVFERRLDAAAGRNAAPALRFLGPLADRAKADAWERSLSQTRTWIDDRTARFLDIADEPYGGTAVRDLSARTEADITARRDRVAEVVWLSPGRDQDLLWGIVAVLSAQETMACIEAYQRDHGEYPASLDTLVPDYLPDLPPDPWSGDAPIYRLTEDGYTLYSVGPDRVDGGGVMTTRGAGREAPDAVCAPIGGR